MLSRCDVSFTALYTGWGRVDKHFSHLSRLQGSEKVEEGVTALLAPSLPLSVLVYRRYLELRPEQESVLVN